MSSTHRVRNYCFCSYQEISLLTHSTLQLVLETLDQVPLINTGSIIFLFSTLDQKQDFYFQKQDISYTHLAEDRAENE